MHRILAFIVVISSFGLIVSCSGMENTAEAPPATENVEADQYPAWYPDQEVVSEDTTIYGYAAAVDQDSANAASKAVSWAESVLKNAVSDKLENIRVQTMEESTNASGLDDTDFLIALREVKEDVSPLINKENSKIKTVEGFDSYRSFAEVSVPKDNLIERIDQRLAEYQSQWNAMKESKAFESF